MEQILEEKDYERKFCKCFDDKFNCFCYLFFSFKKALGKNEALHFS
jgi:hypothetical protein